MIEKQDLGIPLGAGSCGDITVHGLHKDTFGTFGHFFGDTRQPGDVDTIALICRTRYKPARGSNPWAMTRRELARVQLGALFHTRRKACPRRSDWATAFLIGTDLIIANSL